VADPVSWTLIEPGWRVVGSDDKELGEVDEVLGDSGIDIFNGLSVSPGWLKGSRYVPSERVTEIVEGSVRLDLTRREFEHLDEAAATPPSREIRADTTDL
jgi:Uncharacterized protein conserved in bacteria (DUF2171)